MMYMAVFQWIKFVQRNLCFVSSFLLSCVAKGMKLRMRKKRGVFLSTTSPLSSRSSPPYFFTFFAHSRRIRFSARSLARSPRPENGKKILLSFVSLKIGKPHTPRNWRKLGEHTSSESYDFEVLSCRLDNNSTVVTTRTKIDFPWISVKHSL